MIILSSLLLLSVTSPIVESTAPAPVVEIAALPTPTPLNLSENIGTAFHSLFDSTIYFGAGTLLGSATILAGAGWGICQLTPWAATAGNECLLSSRILGIAAIHSFAQIVRKSPLFSFFFKEVPSSRSSWDLNKKLLSEIPALSHEDRELLQFLQQHWLAKVTGCYPFHVDWMCPSFGISLQVHPETTNSYARDPANKYSDTYKNRVEAWKHFLPHPQHFPLILTRPSSILEYLPASFEMPQDEEIQHAVGRLSLMANESLMVVDLTSVLPSGTLDRNHWLDAWHSYAEQFSKVCNEHAIDLSKILCIQRVQQKDIGGIRLLPLSSSAKENTEEHYQFLLEWISRFGLTANRVELDRSLFSLEDTSLQEQSSVAVIPIEFESQQQWVCFLESIEQSWKSEHLQKTFMFKGTLQVLKDLCAFLPQEKWEEIMHSPTRSSTVQLAFSKIKLQLQHLLQEEERISFQDTVSCIEQIQADLTSVLEIFSPFNAEDFYAAFRHYLTCIPHDLQPLTGYGIHASAMTSLAGIFKAVERTIGRAPRILFGENTYFECINASEHISPATSVVDATEQDWKDVDLILAQFNPTVKRINFEVTEYQATEYHVEKIADVLHHALRVREGRPLSIAVDCTLDYSDSPRVSELLAKFQNEIKNGDLNIICYRSGLKFDLFGMDNYCGAPLFMLNNRDAKWSCFDALLNDPVLQTDRLSINWFCLAYQNAAPYLEMYRKQIFDNTRAVLDKIPSRLFSEKNVKYRVIPVDADADPSFIDIKIFGPAHTFRGELLVGVYLTIKCMEAGYPLLYRPGIGFPHPNLAVLFGKECTTVRLTVGLDPAQVDVIVRCLENIDALNGPAEELLAAEGQ